MPANFEYIGSGEAETLGCAVVSMLVYYNNAYSEGSIAYLKHKAMKGILERIAVKRLIIRQDKATGGMILFLYQDTLNSLYNETDLIPYQQAVDLAEAYKESLRLDTIAALKMCGN